MSHGRSMCMPKRKAKILIVDDAQINRIILCELLRDQYQILEAEDGKKALEIMKEDKMIDLVLLDIVMPNMDGYQVLEKMKEQRYLEYLPVIIISSEGNTTSMEKAYELGATDYIRRPFESYIINRRIKNTLMLYEKRASMRISCRFSLLQLVSTHVNGVLIVDYSF